MRSFQSPLHSDFCLDMVLFVQAADEVNWAIGFAEPGTFVIVHEVCVN